MQPETLKILIDRGLVPTNIPGAFTMPAADIGFPRPAHSDGESRGTKAGNRITPYLEPQPGRIHAPRRAEKHRRPPGPEVFYTPNWSGCAFDQLGLPSGDSWWSVEATWMIPTVTQPSQPPDPIVGWESASWVGIDGFYTDPASAQSTSVLQAGVSQNVDPYGGVSYAAWYEWYTPEGDPSGQFPYVVSTNITNMPVSPGQSVYARVMYQIGIEGDPGSYGGWVYFENSDTGDVLDLFLLPPPGAGNGQTVEWIMEAPSYTFLDSNFKEETVQAPLAAFTPFSFLKATAKSLRGTVYDPVNGHRLYQSADYPAASELLTTVELASTSVAIGYWPHDVFGPL